MFISGSEDVGGCLGNFSGNMVTKYALCDSQISIHR